MNTAHETIACPICHSDRTCFLFEGRDLTFGYPDSALMYQCKACHHLFAAGTLTPEQLTDMYSNYYPRADFNVDDYKPHKEKKGFLYWLDGEEAHAYRHVPENVRVLDIGCGYCETLGYHKARGCDVYGVEADENARRIAERFGFNVEIGLFDPKKYEANSFDYVTMDNVLEHVIDPLKTFRDVNGILKPGGKLIAAIPNPSAWSRYWFGQFWSEWHLPFHRHFYTRRSIEILAGQSGYEIEMMKSATESSFLLKNWARMFYIVFMGHNGRKSDTMCMCNGEIFDSDMKKKLPVKLYLFLKRIRFLCLSMRLADLFGRGNHNILIMRKTETVSQN